MFSSSTQPIRKRWAFLVGINHYIDPQHPDLNFCVNDVQVLEKMLTQVGYQVTCLNDDCSGQYIPSKNNILAELKTFCRSHPDDLLLLYFACHGVRLKGKPYLVVQDTRSAWLEEQSIALKEIERQLLNSDATRKILLLDACHAGIDMGRDISDPEFIKHVYEQAEGFAFLAASTAQQKAFEFNQVKQGVFGYFVRQGLQGKADFQDKGFVSVDDLRNYVLHSIRDWSKSQGGLVQEPTDRREGIGDFILVDYRNQSRPDFSLKIQDSQKEEYTNRKIYSNPKEGKLSLAMELKVKGIDARLNQLKAQYQAVIEQLNETLASDQKVVLETKLQQLEDKIENLDREKREIINESR